MHRTHPFSRSYGATSVKETEEKREESRTYHALKDVPTRHLVCVTEKQHPRSAKGPTTNSTHTKSKQFDLSWQIWRVHPLPAKQETGAWFKSRDLPDVRLVTSKKIFWSTVAKLEREWQHHFLAWWNSWVQWTK